MHHAAAMRCWCFAVGSLVLSGPFQTLLLLLLLLPQDFLRTGCDLEVSLKDLRLLLPTLSLDAAAIAGQAVALSQWHQVMHSTATGDKCRRLIAEHLLAVLQQTVWN
jgi:hypothetical protein